MHWVIKDSNGWVYHCAAKADDGEHIHAIFCALPSEAKRFLSREAAELEKQSMGDELKFSEVVMRDES